MNESFRNLLLRLRGRIRLNQRELAAQMGVHVHSIQGWEAGSNYPGVASLRALIAAAAQAGAFTPGQELDEAAALWAAAAREAPRLRVPFDRAWFETIVPPRPATTQGEAALNVAAPTPASVTRGETRRVSWGQAPDIAGFVGRATEREILTQWVRDEQCRVVAVFGLGGIGKSLLATRVAQDLAPSFDFVFWRSLRDAPTPSEWLAEALGYLAPGEVSESGSEPAMLRRLMELLNESRCLLVLDNVETVLQPGGPVGAYRAGYEQYGALLRQAGEVAHRSCFIVTSREEPTEIRLLLGERGPVRALDLGGLGAEDGRNLLHDKRLEGDEATWQALVRRYGGNGLALRVVGEAIRELFGGSVADYLEYTDAASGVMVSGLRDLLGAQMQRLSETEQELLRRMAVEREPVGIAELAADLGPRFGRAATLEAAEGLRRRSLLERAEGGRQFGLQSVVLEYVTEQLIQDVSRELASGEPVRLLRQPLIKAMAKEYVRRSQERQLSAPIVEQLVATHGSVRAEHRLLELLEFQRGQAVEEQGYGPGNIVNLLGMLRGDLRGTDLSGLAIRQAYLQDIETHGASLAGAHLSETVLGEAFGYTTAMALGASGDYLVAGTENGEVCLWRVADRTLVATMPGHAGGMRGVTLSRDGRLIASGGLDGTVRLWDAEGGRALTTFQGHTSSVWGVALSEDGQLLASASGDGTVRLWDTASGRALGTLQGHVGEVWRVALSRDGRLVASSGLDGTVRLWDADSGRALAALHGHVGAVWAVALSGDGRLVASAGTDGTVRLWDTEGGRMLATLQGHVGTVWHVALSEDGQLVASGGLDGTIRLWDSVSGRALAAFHGNTGGVFHVGLTADGQLLASVGGDGTVRLWDTAGARTLTSLHGYAVGVWGVALSGDGSLVASGGYDGTVWLWDTETGQALATLKGHVGGVRSVALNGDGRLVASGGLDGTVRVWDAKAGQALATLKGHAGSVWRVALSGDGRLVASGGVDGTVRVWDSASGRPLADLQADTGAVWGVALSGDGRLLASVGTVGTVRLWGTADGQPLAALEGHDGGAFSVALSRDGRLAASGGADGTVRLWEAETGRARATLRGHTGSVRGVALSGDGRVVASVDSGGTVRLWETAEASALATLHGHAGAAMGLALSGDGRLVASGGVDGIVRIWDRSSGSPLSRTLRPERRYEGVDITGLTGVTEAQRGALLALGAVDRGSPPASDLTS